MSNWYSYILVQYINNDGSVKGSVKVKNLRNELDIDEHYGLVTSPETSKTYPHICLYRGERQIATFDLNEKSIIACWNLYVKIRDIKNPEEASLVGEIYRKDEQIIGLESKIDALELKQKVLEKELEDYRQILTELKDLYASVKK